MMSNVQLDLAINMKAALLASFFMLLLQVEPFICIPTICPWGNQEFDQVDPGGAESYDYEYKYSEEIKEVANVSDGDRLVGGRVTNTRSTQHSEGGKFRSGNFLSWSAGIGTAFQTRWPALVRGFYLSFLDQIGYFYYGR